MMYNLLIWAQATELVPVSGLSKNHPKTDTDSGLRNVVF
jgi:hypothetical protein